MVLQNSINVNANTPLLPLMGGLGVSNPTANGILIANGASAVSSRVLTAGQILIGTTSSSPSSATLTAGTGVSITSASGAITISSQENIVDQTGSSVTMAVNTIYFSDSASLITFTLPTNAVKGSFVKIIGEGIGLWKIAQAASQRVFFGNMSTTSGTGGSVNSTVQYDCITLRANTAGVTSTWIVESAVGNLDII